MTVEHLWTKYKLIIKRNCKVAVQKVDQSAVATLLLKKERRKMTSLADVKCYMLHRI